MKTCISAGKLMKQFGNPPFLKEPPFQLSPLFLSNFFMIPLFVQTLKTRNLSLILGGGELCKNSQVSDSIKALSENMNS